MNRLFDALKSILIFKEPEPQEKFILKETPSEKKENSEEGIKNSNDKESDDDKDESKKSKSKKIIRPLSIRKIGGNSKTFIKHKGDNKRKDKEKNKDEKQKNRDFSTKLEENLDIVKKYFSIPKSSDVVLREFKITAKDREISAFIVFIDGLTSKELINTNILQPLMILSKIQDGTKQNDAYEFIKDSLYTINQISEATELEKVGVEVNFGGCALFIDGSSKVLIAEAKGWEHRGIEKPNNEIVLRGPQEGFNETLRANTGILRRTMRDPDLIIESAEVGVRSKTPVSICYVKDIVNDSLVEEVKRRVKSIKIDYLLSSGQLEQLIEDNSSILIPQVIATERPDRVAYLLSQGRVAIVVSGSPFVLVVPSTFESLVHSPEDQYIRYTYANLLRTIRLIAMVLSLLLPGLFIAITNFHIEMIPTDLLLAIEASRETVPFPSVVEIIIMELAFELIREAGIRIPSPIGPTLGIIGALILGQAAVAANIVSPILIIIVAVTGIGSFAIPNYDFAYAIRILRFVYVLLGALAGFLGITLGLYIQGIIMVSAKSFGVPILAPFAPRTRSDNMNEKFYRDVTWRQERRPDFLNPKDVTRQPDISREWTKGSRGDEDNE